MNPGDPGVPLMDVIVTHTGDKEHIIYPAYGPPFPACCTQEKYYRVCRIQERCCQQSWRKR